MRTVDYVSRPMPKQEPSERVRNFDEVALGYPAELAREEASRCLACKKPGCVQGCPVGIAIPGFIELVAGGDFAAGIRTIKEPNALPAVCGRVCPQEEQCEKECILGKKGDPVAIGRLERFLADWEAGQGALQAPPSPGGWGLGYLGPVTEGLAAFFGLCVLLVAAVWLAWGKGGAGSDLDAGSAGDAASDGDARSDGPAAAEGSSSAGASVAPRPPGAGWPAALGLLVASLMYGW